MVASAALILIVTSAVAWDGRVPAWEVEILEFINGWPDWPELPMWALQQVGVLASPVITGLIIVWFTRNWRHLVPFVLVLPLKLGIENRHADPACDCER